MFKADGNSMAAHCSSDRDVNVPADDRRCQQTPQTRSAVFCQPGIWQVSREAEFKANKNQFSIKVRRYFYVLDL